MSDPTNTDAATSNTDAATTDTDAQTSPDAGGFEYPDGSKPPVDPDTGLPLLEDRTADFPDVDAVEVEAEPVLESGRRLGATSGMSAYRGLAAKRRERGFPVEEPEAEEDEQGQEGTQDAPEGSGTTDDTPEGENGPETGDQGSGDEADESGEGEQDDTPDDEDAPEPADEGYDPTAHTVAEVQAYLSEHPDQATYVLDRERAGKARVTLIGA